VLLPVAERNAKARKDAGAGAYVGGGGGGGGSGDVLDSIQDMREYDVPYYVRVSIDAGVRVGCWYAVDIAAANARVIRLPNMVEKVRGGAGGGGGGAVVCSSIPPRRVC
jgi:DNA polymerase epsilon subunit 1